MSLADIGQLSIREITRAVTLASVFPQSPLGVANSQRLGDSQATSGLLYSAVQQKEAKQDQRLIPIGLG